MGIALVRRMGKPRRTPTPVADSVPLYLMPEDCDGSTPEQRLAAKRHRLVVGAIDYLIISGGTGADGLYAKLMLNALLQHDPALRRKFAAECKELGILTEKVAAD
jgi:hypothetical protein